MGMMKEIYTEMSINHELAGASQRIDLMRDTVRRLRREGTPIWHDEAAGPRKPPPAEADETRVAAGMLF